MPQAPSPGLPGSGAAGPGAAGHGASPRGPVGSDRTAVWLRAGLLGVAAGLLSGLFGVGGGIIMVPILVAWFALDQRRASATSLLAIVPIAVASAVGYGLNGNVDRSAGLLLLLGGVAGGQVGSLLLRRTPIHVLQLAFGLLSLAAAARLLFEGGTAGTVGAAGSWEGLFLVLLGVASGVLAGLLGVGGGIVMVPGLVILTGADASTARGTSLFVIVLTALTATATNLRHGLVDVPVALVAGLVGVPAGLAGAALGQWLPERVALALFAGLLVLSGVRMIRQGLRGRRAQPGHGSVGP